MLFGKVVADNRTRALALANAVFGKRLKQFALERRREDRRVRSAPAPFLVVISAIEDEIRQEEWQAITRRDDPYLRVSP